MSLVDFTSPLRVGEVIGEHYRIVGFYRRGGMGELFDAKDERSGERVAVKVLRQGHANEERFEREGQVLAALRDPGIVRHIAHGKTRSGERFIAMEWLEGEDLAERLRRGALSVTEVVAIGIRIARALAAAHATGVVHRDLKPSNVFLPHGDPAQAKLLDFGLARAEVAGRELTRTGTTLGTRGYMAPEQALGEKRATGPKADLFSLGCVLYEALAGAGAFESSDSHEVLRRILFEDPLPLAHRAPHVPLDLVNLIETALSKEPDGRPKDAEAFAAALTKIALGARKEGVRLTVVDGKGAGLSRFVVESPLDIGKHASATFAIDDSTASRFHCEIVRHGDRLVVRDLESTNGLFVDGARVAERTIASGAILGVGASRVRVELAEDTLAVASAVDRARSTDTNVLLEGAGWDARAFAEALHAASGRRRAGFFAVYGGALRIDDLACASGGTVLLEEADVMPASTQTALAQFFQTKMLPSARGPFAADVRVVTHSTCDLRLAVNAKRFRPDLFYALAGVRLAQPAQGERLG